MEIKKAENIFFSLVEVKGFEPPTLWSQTRCANRTALHLVFLKCDAKVELIFDTTKNFWHFFLKKKLCFCFTL